MQLSHPGALPFFEMTSDFIAAFEQFLQERCRGWQQALLAKLGTVIAP